MAAFKLGDAFNNLLSGPSLMDTVKAGGRRAAQSPDGKENDERPMKGPRFSPSKAPTKGSGRGSDGALGSSPLGENGAKKTDDLLGQISALLDDKLEPLTIHVNAMGHDLAAFKEETGKEFKQFVDFANNHDTRITSLEVQCSELQTKGSSNEDYEARLVALDTEQKAFRAELLAQKSAPPPASNSQKRGPPWIHTPRQERDIFVMTNLGWNLKKHEALEKAREVINRSGAPKPANMMAPYGYGSCVEMKWHTIAEGLQASETIRNAKIFGHRDLPIWCGQISTREERAPGRIFKTVSEAVTKAMDGRDEHFVICTRTRKIHVEDKLIGTVIAGEWKWDEDSFQGIPTAQYKEAVRKAVDEAVKK